MSQERFFAPRLVGARFDQHSLPLEILKDFSVFEEILLKLAELKPGWLDGKGLALNPDGLQALVRDFDNWFDPTLPLPYLYPTAEGGVQVEWSINQWEISLEIDLLQRRAQYQALFVPDQRTQESEFNLADQAEWVRLNQALSAISAVPA